MYQKEKSFNYLFLFIVTLICLTYIKNIHAMHLVYVQNISSSNKTFVIKFGRLEGIVVGQKALFVTDNINLIATAIESTRHFSMWRLDAPNAAVPFQKRQYVVMNSTTDSIWQKMYDKEKMLTEQTRQHRLHELRQRYPLLSPSASSWNFKFAMSHAFFETLSSVKAHEDEQRNGMQFEMTFAKKFNYNLEIDGGLRYDRETVTQNDPEATIPSDRYLLIFDITYHFPQFLSSINNLYASLGAGYGLSRTNVVNDVVSSGPSMILPIIRLGHVSNISRDYSLLIECVFESISTTEVFNDSTAQETSILNGKIAAGIRF